MMKNFALSFVALIVLIEYGNCAATGAATAQQPHDSITLDLPFKINEDCHQPRETGRCFALFHRFAFNVEKRVCEQFIYGGCGGNKNNFETLAECENICRTLTDEEITTTISTTAVAGQEMVADISNAEPQQQSSDGTHVPSNAGVDDASKLTKRHNN